jgi:hypothetical protein
MNTGRLVTEQPVEEKALGILQCERRQCGPALARTCTGVGHVDFFVKEKKSRMVSGTPVASSHLSGNRLVPWSAATLTKLAPIVI